MDIISYPHQELKVPSYHQQALQALCRLATSQWHLRLQALGQQGLSYLGPESWDMAQPSSENVDLTRTESQPIKNNDVTNKNGAFFKMFQTNLTHKNVVSTKVSTGQKLWIRILQQCHRDNGTSPWS